MGRNSTSRDPIRQIRDLSQDSVRGEELLLRSMDRDGFKNQAADRYRLDFPQLDEWNGNRDLQIGAGLGIDYQRFVESGAKATSLELAPGAMELTEHHLKLFGPISDLHTGNAESLKRMVWQLNEPLADFSGLKVMFISQPARGHGI